MPILFFLLIAMPIIELLLLLEVGGRIGGLNTVLVVIATAVLGSYLLRREGVATLTSLQTKMNQGQMPLNEMAAGVAIAAGGALLLTPGFITDAIGLLLVLPGSRGALGHWLLKRMRQSPNVHFTAYSSHQTTRPRADDSSSHNVIEGEYEEKSKNS